MALKLKTYLDSQQHLSNMRQQRKAFNIFNSKKIAFIDIMRPWHLCLS